MEDQRLPRRQAAASVASLRPVGSVAGPPGPACPGSCRTSFAWPRAPEGRIKPSKSVSEPGCCTTRSTISRPRSRRTSSISRRRRPTPSWPPTRATNTTRLAKELDDAVPNRTGTSCYRAYVRTMVRLAGIRRARYPIEGIPRTRGGAVPPRIEVLTELLRFLNLWSVAFKDLLGAPPGGQSARADRRSASYGLAAKSETSKGAFRDATEQRAKGRRRHGPGRAEEGLCGQGRRGRERAEGDARWQIVRASRNRSVGAARARPRAEGTGVKRRSKSS